MERRRLQCFFVQLIVKSLLIVRGAVAKSNTGYNKVLLFSGLPRAGVTEPSEPLLFYIRNNLEGDVEFIESNNVSIEVRINAESDEINLVRTYYALLANGTVVDFQLYMENDVSWSWLLFGGYIGAGVLCLTAACVVSIVLKRRIRRKNKSFEIEMNNMAGKLVNPRGSVDYLVPSYERRVSSEDPFSYLNSAQTSGANSVSTFQRGKNTNASCGITEGTVQNVSPKIRAKTEALQNPRKVTVFENEVKIIEEESSLNGKSVEVLPDHGVKSKRLDACTETCHEEKYGTQNKVTTSEQLSAIARPSKKRQILNESYERKVEIQRSSKVSDEPNDKTLSSQDSLNAFKPDQLPESRRNSANQSYLAARSMFLLAVLLAVAMASSTLPRARILIRVPPYMVKEGSKVFFNGRFFGRLVTSQWPGDETAIKQFAVSQATSVVPTLSSCSKSCDYACEVNTNSCICPRGYKLDNGTCTDFDECTLGRSNCVHKAKCMNTLGSFRCECKKGYWGDGYNCTACSMEPCPENFFQSKHCTSTMDRECRACTPKCTKSTYEAYGCGRTFDRKCVDISVPLTRSKRRNITENMAIRKDSTITVKPSSSILLENLLNISNTLLNMSFQEDTRQIHTLDRGSAFEVDVEVFDSHLIPRYRGFNGEESNENEIFKRTPGFDAISKEFCRFPAADYYTITHVLHKKRETAVANATCLKTCTYSCPEGVEEGEVYYYRTLNNECDTLPNSSVCVDAPDCNLHPSKEKLYCTGYTTILGPVFDINEFSEEPLSAFSRTSCKDSFLNCEKCKNRCKKSCGSTFSCSCCFKGCIKLCSAFYTENSVESCHFQRKSCARGDTSEFILFAHRPSNLTLRYNCYLEIDVPEDLYRIRYRIRHANGRYNSSWVLKTVTSREQGSEKETSFHSRTTQVDSLKITNKLNFGYHKYLYIKAERTNANKPFRFKVTRVDESVKPEKAVAGSVNVQLLHPFAVSSQEWNNTQTCRKLSNWEQIFRKPFDLNDVNVNITKKYSNTPVFYNIYTPSHPPILEISLPNTESVLRYLKYNSSIRNDASFQSSLSRGGMVWNLRIKGEVTACPGVINVRVVDEVDQILVLHYDVLLLCPNTWFDMMVEVPRRGSADRERLFTVYLSDSKKQLKLQLAVVAGGRRNARKAIKRKKDSKRNPWTVLFPLFSVIGSVLVVLILLMIYAQMAAPKKSKSKSRSAGWSWVKVSFKGKTKYRGTLTCSNNPNRLRGHHLILVVIVVVARVTFSLVFSFSTVYASLTVLHSHNVDIVLEFRQFVRNKTSESSTITLEMDQFREREIKSHLDHGEGVQKSCDHFLSEQMNHLRFKMRCSIQANYLRMFNKLSKKVTEKLTEGMTELKRKLRQKVDAYQTRVKEKMDDIKQRIADYAEQVYKNGWFSLPRTSFAITNGREKREMLLDHNKENEKVEQRFSSSSNLYSLPNVRRKRALSDSKFIRFLDFIGVLDVERFKELEESISRKTRFLKNGFSDLSQALKTGKSPTHPLSTVLLCPFRYMKDKTKENLKDTLQDLRDNPHAQDLPPCLNVNMSSFFALNGTEDNGESLRFWNSFSEKIYFEDMQNLVRNISSANKSSLLEAQKQGLFFNIEKGDILEEEIDAQKEAFLDTHGNDKDSVRNLTSIYDANVFVVTKKAVWGVIAILDILLLIYRSTKTYQVGLQFIQGFEETIEHDPNEFQEKIITIKQRAKNTLCGIFQLLARAFTTFLTFCKNLQKRVVSTNFLPIVIAVGVASIMLYLSVAVIFNVINVTVIEELGGFRLVSARLDADALFTNLAIADSVNFINEHDMEVYKDTVNTTVSEFKDWVEEVNKDQQGKVQLFNSLMCSLDANTTDCANIEAELVNFDVQSCILPKLSTSKFEGYNSDAYREQLKMESKKYVDAFRNILLDTIYFAITFVSTAVLIALFSSGAFLFLKSRGMVRVRTVHVYRDLPPEILEQFKITMQHEDEKNGEGENDKPGRQGKLEIPEVFLTDSRQNIS